MIGPSTSGVSYDENGGTVYKNRQTVCTFKHLIGRIMMQFTMPYPDEQL